MGGRQIGAFIIIPLLLICTCSSSCDAMYNLFPGKVLSWFQAQPQPRKKYSEEGFLYDESNEDSDPLPPGVKKVIPSVIYAAVTTITIKLPPSWVGSRYELPPYIQTLNYSFKAFNPYGKPVTEEHSRKNRYTIQVDITVLDYSSISTKVRAICGEILENMVHRYDIDTVHRRENNDRYSYRGFSHDAVIVVHEHVLLAYQATKKVVEPMEGESENQSQGDTRRGEPTERRHDFHWEGGT